MPMKYKETDPVRLSDDRESIKQGKLPFEKKAEQALGKSYCAPVKGYTLTAGAKFVDR